jgi:hypothetical protein
MLKITKDGGSSWRNIPFGGRNSIIRVNIFNTASVHPRHEIAIK